MEPVDEALSGMAMLVKPGTKPASQRLLVIEGAEPND